MRRQRLSCTLPSQDDSSTFRDSESGSNISMPETVCNPINSPEPEACKTNHTHHHLHYGLPDEQVTNVPFFITPPIASSSIHTFNPFIHSIDDNFDFSNCYICYNTPYDSGIFHEDYLLRDMYLTHENVGGLSMGVPTTHPAVTNYGTVRFMLKHLIRIEISSKGALHVTNQLASCKIAINGTGDKSCIIHPYGKVFQDKKEIHMTTLDRKAKITSRGIIFTSTSLCLSYLVDASGTKTTSEKFKSLNDDFSMEVFYDSMMPNNAEECHRIVNDSSYNSYLNGDEVWTLGEFRILQNQLGDIEVTRSKNQYIIKASPTTGQVIVQILEAEIIIELYPNNYFVIRKEDKSVTASLTKFIVQNGNQKAGINSSGEISLF